MKFSKELMKGSAEIIVLQALEEGGATYGYQLIKSIGAASGNIFEFQEGTLYPLLYRLEKKDMVISEEKMAPNGKIRRYYAITHSGKKFLQERTKEIGLFMNSLKQILHLT